MKPIYQDGYVPNAHIVFNHLLELDWIQVTEARLEYFMADRPLSYNYGKPPFDREYHSKGYTEPVFAIQLNKVTIIDIVDNNGEIK